MNIGHTLVNWYELHQRTLPWRETNEPYFIWISEIILQQTRVNQGIPYYLEFTKKYPSLQELAKANIDEILRSWQGLGYYSRAHNLHYTAQYLIEHHQGQFPKTYKELKKLKGIGDYTAAAIASISFGEPAPVLDGNVIRVLSRLYGIFTLPLNKTGKDEYISYARTLMGQNKPGSFNQGIMEFGALQCKPLNPNCLKCLLQTNCYAYENDKVELLPPKKQKKVLKTRFLNYFVFKKENQFFIQKRSNKDIWKGLFEFPILETEKPFSWEDLIVREDFPKYINSKNIISFPKYIEKRQILSHQKIFSRFWILNGEVEYEKISNCFQGVAEENLNNYSFPKVTHEILSLIKNEFVKDGLGI